MKDKQLEELAAYYDTHDTSAELEEAVEVAPAPKAKRHIVYSVRLSPEDVERLRVVASEREERDRSMVKRWILERLAEEEAVEDDQLGRFRNELAHRMASVVDEAARAAHLA